jgi:hypothetical protein
LVNLCFERIFRILYLLAQPLVVNKGLFGACPGLSTGSQAAVSASDAAAPF